MGQGLCGIGGGNFEITPLEGCAPLTINIKNNVPNTITVGYSVAYDGSPNPAYANYSSYTYPAGNYTILQYGAISSGVFSSCKQIKVYETDTPWFEYASCGGGKVRLVFTDNYYLNAYDKTEINWGDGKIDTWVKGNALTFEHVYASTSLTPVISVKGVYTVNTSCKSGTARTIPVSFQQVKLDDIQISKVEVKNNGSIEMNYAGITSIATQIQYSTDGNNFSTHGTRSSGGAAIFYRMDNINSSQIYQLRLSSRDLCGGQLESGLVTTMVVTGKSADEKNVLSWNKYPEGRGFTGYELFRDGVSLKTFGINETSFTDEDVQCGDQFEYQVVARTNSVTSTSAPVTVKTEIAQPKPITQASVSVSSDKQIVINAVIPGAGPKSNYELTIEKSEAGSTTFKRLVTLSNENEYIDSDVQANEQSYCYRLSYQNACGQKLPPSDPICSITLKNALSNFTWNTERPFLEPVGNYVMIQKGQSSGSADEIDKQLSSSFTPSLNAQSDLEYTFQVRAHSASGDFESFSNIFYYKRSAGIFVPDAFSPNGDDVNDQLLAKADQVQSFSFSVLDRWGQVVFHSNDLAVGWDGRINGKNAAVGAYVYKIRFVDDINQEVEKSGTFMLLR
ncbi:T9SS type B sorting domain-containing protein [Dyadobacter psychrotolerans]|uniref:T9SS type B sorting domain-containing protein n=2 Tax=Dyadobacter psychrotolerans TaxID=2541721 RepID=A0A4R5DIL7_9BACT|nr:T9SS type B sorting domain-containing protein [Dyadobacter psychrotolerans]